MSTMDNHKKLRVQSIELVNEEGKVYGELSVVNGCPGLHLYDENGVLRASLGVNNASVSGVTLYDASGMPTVNLCTHDDGSAVEFFTPAPNYRTALSIDNYTSIGQPRLVFLDKEGRIHSSTNPEDAVGDYFSKGIPAQLRQELEDE